MIEERIVQSSFNQRVNRDLYVIGNERQVQEIRKIMEALSFVRVFPVSVYSGPKSEVYFVVGAIDFGSSERVQSCIRSFNQHDEPNVKKIAFSVHKNPLKSEQFMVCAEIGVLYSACGQEKETDLRAYIKRISLEADQLGTIESLESETAKFMKRSDFEGLRSVDERLSKMDKDAEDVLKLRSTIHFRLGRTRTAEGFLKRMLQADPQNLWAAAQLGKFYLRQKKATEGIEILEKLSVFQSLNGERLLQLGNAYLNIGQPAKAEKVLQQGAKLNAGHDDRFTEGLAKASIAKGDVKGALTILSQQRLPESVVAYLNMRAIMAFKTGKQKEAFALYKHALDHGPENEIIRAKLFYNFGLGCVRSNEIEAAVNNFETSVKLGGSLFKKAAHPLDISKKIKKNLESGANKKPQTLDPSINSLEFESFNAPTRSEETHESIDDQPQAPQRRLVS